MTATTPPATFGAKAIAALGTWGRPPDVAAKVALGLAVICFLLAVVGRGRSLLGLPWDPEDGDPDQEPPPDPSRDRRRFLAIVAFVAALASVAYVSIYLRGGPRIVDATSYFLQGRALSHGDLAWLPRIDAPSASFRGRFLLARDTPSGAILGGLFPPGYPLLLALGFLLRAPMLIGPLLAGALAIATYRLARALAVETLDERLVEPAARGAALLSLFCAALRYHTADTMSHGAAAIGIALALLAALASRPALAGLAVGFVIATRPISALPIAGVCVVLLVGRAGQGSRLRALARLGLGLVPGVALLLLSQHAVTGSWWSSTQRAYYAVSDGPPGCFRWGFGKGIGCLYEHGDFVHARLPSGYGLLEAAGTTLRRLHHHLLDVANLEPLALLVLFGVVRGRRAGGVRAAGALVGLHVLAYAPFYFDGDYPGGGARFFADVLPIEHALVAVGLGSAARASAARLSRFTLATLGLAAIGFAIHASHEHVKLRDRDGGRPMFEPDLLARLPIKAGLVFVDTDHGFALGHDPQATDPSTSVVVARLRGDDRDRLLFERLERPLTYLYQREPEGGGPADHDERGPTITAWTPPETGATHRFEAEAEWPPLAQTGGFAAPVWTNSCASRSRALAVTPMGPAKDGTPVASATIALPVPSSGRWAVEVHVVHNAFVPHTPQPPVGLAQGTVELAGTFWTWWPPATCQNLGEREIQLEAPEARLRIVAAGGAVAVDYVTMRKL